MKGNLSSAIIVFIVLIVVIGTSKSSIKDFYLFNKWVPKWYTIFMWFYTAWGIFNLLMVLKQLYEYYK